MALSRDDFAAAFRSLAGKAATPKDLHRAFRAQADAPGARKALGAVLVDLGIVAADRADVLSGSAPVDPRRHPDAVDALGEMLIRDEVVNEAEFEKLVLSFISLKEKKLLPSVPVPKPLLQSLDFEWEVGHGLHGTTYRARREALPHECGVKIFRTEGFASAEERQSFAARLKALVGRKERGLVELYDAGEADGVPYAVTAFIEGPSLESLIVEHKGTVHRGVEILEKVATALAPLHAKGEAHGAIRGSAVLLDKEDRPFLAEFGWTGKGTPSDDVFALGELLYEAATGVPPYAGFHAKELKPPSRFNPQAAGSVENVILKALCLDPARRYKDAGELAADLRKLLNHEEVPLFKPGRPPGEKRPVKGLVLVAAAAAVAIAVVLFLVTRGGKTEEPRTGPGAKKTDKRPVPPPWVPPTPPEEKKPEKKVEPPSVLAQKVKAEEWKKKGPIGINEVREFRYGLTNAMAERDFSKMGQLCDEAVTRGFFDGKERDFIFYYSAVGAFASGESTKALASITRAMELAEGETKYVELRFEIYLSRNENRKALADLALRYGKNTADLNKPIAELTKQIAASPDDASLYRLRGAYLHHKRNYPDAARDFARAVSSGDSKTRYFLSLSLAADERKAEAIEAVRAFIAAHGSDPGIDEARQFLAELEK